MNNNWLEVSPKVGLGNLLNRSNNFWARLGNKDRQIKMGNSMTHFHLARNIEYTLMINCSIYISWKTKFAILTILNGKTSKKNSVLIDKELIPFFSHIDERIHLAYIPYKMSPKWKTWHYVQSTFLLNLFLKFSFEAPATEDIKHVCDRQTYHWLCKKNTPTNLSECDYFPVTQCLLIWAHINVDSLNVKYRKISKISPWAYIFTGTLSRAYIRCKGELLWFSNNLRGNRKFWEGLQKRYIYVQKDSSLTCLCCI